MLKLAILSLVIISASCKKQDSAKVVAPSYGKAASNTHKLIEYNLTIQDDVVSVEYTKALKSWVESLHRGLSLTPDNLSEEIFLKSNLTLKSSDESFPVYQSIINPKRYLEPKRNFVIDFSTNKIGTLGVGGISLHMPPSKNIAVLLAPYKGMHFMGVLIGDPKTESPDPKFSDKSVTFHF